LSIDAKNIICFTLSCADLERSVAFYTEELGATEFLRMTPGEVERHDFWGQMGYEAGIDYEAVMLRLGSQATETYLELIKWAVPGERPALGPRDFGLTRFSISIEDADAAHAALVARGVTVKGPPVANRLGNLSLKAFLVLDPDGVPIELVEFGRAKAEEPALS